MLEGALADTQFVIDFRRRAVVADGPETAAGLEFGEDLGFEVIDLRAAGGVQADVDFPVRAEGGDVAFEGLAGLERLENLVGENQAAVGAVDDRLVAEVGFSKNDEIDFLFQTEIRGREVHVPRDPAGGDDTVGLLVEVDMDDVVFPHVHAEFLLAERDQQILGQAPVEERADTGDRHAFQAAELAGHDLGRLERGDRAVLGIVVKKDVERFADAATPWNFPVRQQDFAHLAAVEKEPEGFFMEDLKGCALADGCHGGTMHSRRWRVDGDLPPAVTQAFLPVLPRY